MNAAATEAATSLIIAPGHKERLDKAPAVLIVAGGLALDAAAEAATSDDKLVVASFSDPSDWMTEDGSPDPAIRTLVSRELGTTVTLAFEGRDTDSVVWEHASKLSKYLLTIGAKKVNFMNLDFALSLLMSQIDDQDERAAQLKGMIASASTIGQRPKAKAEPKVKVERSTIAPIVDTELGVTYIPGDEGKRDILMEAAVSRLRTYEVYDDLRDPKRVKAFKMHDLQVVVRTADGRRVYEVPGVHDLDLGNPRTYLSRVRGGESIVVAPGGTPKEQIENAVRNHDADLVPVTDVLRRLGWALVGGKWGYVHPEGFQTAQGRTAAAKALIGESLMDIIIKDTSALTHEDELAAAKNALCMMNELTDLNLWIGFWGTGFSSVAGLPVGAVPTITGKHGSGKTVVSKAFCSFLARKYATGNMFVIDQSAKNVAKAGDGLHHAWLLVDDMRKRGSAKKAEEQASAIENLVRAGYAGASAKDAANKYDPKTREWGVGVADQSSPATAISGEQLPDGDGLESSLERLYSMQIAHGFNIFASGNSRLFESMSDSEHPTTHLAFYIRWIAEGIEAAGSLDAWAAQWAEVREEIEDSRDALPVSKRVKEVAAVPETGLRVWATYMLSIGALDQEQFDKLIARVHDTVTAAAYRHGTEVVQSNDVPEYEAMLNSLRAAVATGSAWVQMLSRVEPDPDPEAESEEADERKAWERPGYNLPLLGVEKQPRGDGENYLAIQPRDALRILGTEARFRTLTERGLRQAFENVAITDAGSSFKKAIIGGLRTNALALPMSVWMPHNDEDLD